MKRFILLSAVLPLCLPHVVLADSVRPALVVLEEPAEEEPPLDTPFIEIVTPVDWEETSLAPPVVPAPRSPLTVAKGEAHRFPWGQCTWFVASKRKIVFRGNAKDWPRNAVAAGYALSKHPVAGAVVVTNEHRVYGHVAFVEAVHGDGSFTLSEANYAGLGVVTRRTMQRGDRRIVTFIL